MGRSTSNAKDTKDNAGYVIFNDIAYKFVY